MRTNLSPAATVLLLVLYLASFGPMVLQSTIFWDDYSLVHASPATLFRIFADSGRPLLAFLYIVVLSLPGGVLVCKLGTLVFGLLTPFLLAACLREARAIHSSEVWAVIAVCALWPLNQSREALIIFGYMLCVTLLFLGTYLALIRRESLPIAFAAAACLFVSFANESNLILFSIGFPALSWGKHEGWTQPTPGGLRRALFRDAPLFATAAAAVAFRQFAFHPTGVYSNFNSASLPSLGALLSGLAWAFHASLWDCFAFAARHGLDTSLLVVGWCTGVAVWRWAMPSAPTAFTKTRSGGMFLFGVLLLIATSVLYLLAGKIPRMVDWDSRHQIPHLPAIALIVIAALRFFPPQVGRLLLASFLGASVSANIEYRLEFLWDGQKQAVLRDGWSRLSAPRNVLVQDEATDFNAMDRQYRFYEYTGMIREALGSQRTLAFSSRLPLSASGFENIVKLGHKEAYNISEAKWQVPQQAMVIQAYGPRPSLIDTLRFMVAGNPSLIGRARELLSARLQPVPGGS